MKYEPQLATLVKAPPSGDQWLHEIKFDGYRIGCHRHGSRVTLTSRNGKDWTAAFPDIVDAVKAMDVDEVMLDGEVAAVLPDGRTSFQAMQQRGGARATGSGGTGSGGTGSGGTIVYFAFDLLHLNGEALLRQPLHERKARLKALLGRGQKGRLRYSEHVDGSGAEILEHACGLGLEGIISKRRDLPYMPGRNDAWRKIKCTRRQEFVIGGFTDPQGSRAGIGALLLGTYAPDGRLICAGRVGTGFSHKLALDLREKLERIRRASPAFSPAPAGPLARTAHWVTPQLVCEVAFTEWTNEGQLRHPSFQGLRLDKQAAEVVREEPAGTPHAPSEPEGTQGSARRPRVRRNR